MRSQVQRLLQSVAPFENTVFKLPERSLQPACSPALLPLAHAAHALRQELSLSHAAVGLNIEIEVRCSALPDSLCELAGSVCSQLTCLTGILSLLQAKRFSPLDCLAVQGRLKSLYSTHRKMQRKRIPVGEVYDTRALRIIVDDADRSQLADAVEACYAALPVVHRLWRQVSLWAAAAFICELDKKI